jgi:hypothetical protein
VDSCLIFHFNKFYFHLKFYFLCNIHKNETKVFDIGTVFGTSVTHSLRGFQKYTYVLHKNVHMSN